MMGEGSCDEVMMQICCGSYVLLLLLMLWLMFKNSPMGWEDEEGFHRGENGTSGL